MEVRADIGVVEAYDWKVERISMPDGRPGVVCHFYDLSERLHFEALLRKSEERYRDLFDSLMEGYCLIEMIYDDGGRAIDYRFLEMNPAFESQTGLKDAKGRTIRELTPEIEASWIEMFAKVAETGESVRFDAGVAALSRRFDVQGFRVDHDGSNKVAIVFNDITERTATEKALQESDERYRAASSAVSDVVWTNNADGLMVGEQRGWAHFTGQSREEYKGYGWSNAVHPEDAQPTIDAWSRAVAEKRRFVFEHRIRRRDGEWRLCSIRAVPILNVDRTIREWVGVHADITDRKRDEERLRSLAAELSESSHRKDEFIATLAHELRNPLAPIRNGLQLIKMAAGQPATIEQARSMMERQLTQMVRLVDDLMDVSRINLGKLELRKERLPLSTVLNSALETSRPLIEQMGHALTVAIPDQALIVDADMTRLAQAFLNLLNNAAKYSDPGGHIRVNVDVQGGEVVVAVTDTGIGMDADHLSRIFGMFTQIGGALDRAQGGLGIGLTLVKRLVDLHGGTVVAKSDGLGMGSEFVVRLPRVLESPEPDVPGAGDEPIVARSSLRVLIVDDNRDGADSLSEMLKVMGNDTRTAYDGQQGVNTAREYRPDVVLLDIGLPKLNGYEACRLIREEPDGKGIVMIAVTGWGQDEDRRRSNEAGFDHHLVKPVDPQALLSLIATLDSARDARR